MIPESASKLTCWHRRTLVFTALALAVSGLVWMAGHYALLAAPDFDGSEPRSLLHQVIILHGIMAYGAAILFGSLLGRHIPAGLKSGRKLISGLSSLSLMIALIVTALLLYYAGSEHIRDISSIAHQVVGVLAVVLVWMHVVQKRSKSRNRA